MDCFRDIRHQIMLQSCREAGRISPRKIVLYESAKDQDHRNAYQTEDNNNYLG